MSGSTPLLVVNLRPEEVTILDLVCEFTIYREVSYSLSNGAPFNQLGAIICRLDGYRIDDKLTELFEKSKTSGFSFTPVCICLTDGEPSMREWKTISKLGAFSFDVAELGSGNTFLQFLDTCIRNNEPEFLDNFFFARDTSTKQLSIAS